MKILILTNNDGGLYQFRKELIERLLTEHQVIISLPYGEYIDRMVDMGCEYIPCEFNRRGTNPLRDINQYLFYKKLIYQVKPNVVFTYTIKPNVYGGMACAKLGIPYIANVTGLGTSIMNPGLLHKLSLSLYRYGLRKAHVVFFQNEANLKFMQRHKVVKKNFGLLPGSGVNLEKNPFEQYPSDDSKIEFVTIGRIMKDKGIDELLTAAEMIKEKHPNIIFTVIGSCDEEEYIEKLNVANKQGTIQYVGRQGDVHSFIKRSHATIHPSYHEGLSNVLLETASSGRPILATDVPGCRETFVDGVSGIAFEARNANALAEAVEKFLSLSNDERSSMGKNGRAIVEKEFDRNLVIEAYDRALSGINKANKTQEGDRKK